MSSYTCLKRPFIRWLLFYFRSIFWGFSSAHRLLGGAHSTLMPGYIIIASINLKNQESPRPEQSWVDGIFLFPRILFWPPYFISLKTFLCFIVLAIVWWLEGGRGFLSIWPCEPWNHPTDETAGRLPESNRAVYPRIIIIREKAKYNQIIFLFPS